MEFIGSLSLKNGYIKSYLEYHGEEKTEEFLKKTLENYKINLETLENINNSNLIINRSNEDLYIKLENLFDYLQLNKQKLRDLITEPLNENIRKKINNNLSKYITSSYLTEEIKKELIKFPSLKFFKYHWETIKENYKVITSNVEYLKYIYDQGCPWDKNISSNAAKYGQLDCLKYLRENNCPWDKWTCSYAAKYGNLDCLKYAYENGCPWDKEICEAASSNGHLDCLKYAHENGCPWNEYTCAKAAINGHLDCLKYAHENNCPWDEYTCLYAAKNGHLDCLKYARENGCPEN